MCREAQAVVGAWRRRGGKKGRDCVCISRKLRRGTSGGTYLRSRLLFGLWLMRWTAPHKASRRRRVIVADEAPESPSTSSDAVAASASLKLSGVIGTAVDPQNPGQCCCISESVRVVPKSFADLASRSRTTLAGFQRPVLRSEPQAILCRCQADLPAEQARLPRPEDPRSQASAWLPRVATRAHSRAVPSRSPRRTRHERGDRRWHLLDERPRSADYSQFAAHFDDGECQNACGRGLDGSQGPRRSCEVASPRSPCSPVCLRSRRCSFCWLWPGGERVGVISSIGPLTVTREDGSLPSSAGRRTGAVDGPRHGRSWRPHDASN